MLYIFLGSDIEKSVQKAYALIDALRLKKPDSALVKIEAKDWSPSVIDEHAGGQGLFSQRYIVFLDRLCEKADISEELIGYLPNMKESANIFIVLEGNVKVSILKEFNKNADKVVVSDFREKVSSKKEFNVFSLADALGMRDSIKSWIIYRQAIENGLEPESIMGTLFWQVKAMFLAINFKTAEEAGLNPFVFNKSKIYSRNYSKQEILNLLEKLTTMYHDAHRGLVDLELEMERLVVSC